MGTEQSPLVKKLVKEHGLSNITQTDVRAFKSKSERIVAIFDGEIIGFNGATELPFIRYHIGLQEVKNTYTADEFKRAGISVEEGVNFKVGIIDRGISDLYDRPLSEEEVTSFKEPGTEVEKLKQTIDIYRRLTNNQYLL